MQVDLTKDFIGRFWNDSILPSLSEYIKIPNKSPLFDPHWENHGHMENAMSHVVDWCDENPIPGMDLKVHRLEHRTPTLLIDIPGDTNGSVLLYGHLDKQPEFTGWQDDLGPWLPVIKNDRLYGRGGADDGYAIYSSIAAIRALKEQKLPIPRIIIIIECSEESGSPDLPYYMDLMENVIGTPGLVIALDSTAGNYDQLWCTTSLRGMLSGTLKVEVLEEGAHSGAAGGMVSSSFRILRRILSRLEDESSGEILPAFLKEQVPATRIREAKAAGEILKGDFKSMFRYAGHGGPVTANPATLVLDNTWHAALEITGIDGIPSLSEAGNVLRPYTSAKIALRLAPTTDISTAAPALVRLLTEDPPNGALVSFEPETPAAGWHAPELTAELEKSLQEASENFFGQPAVCLGCGGSIPFMQFLAAKFPDAQFVVTGVLGPHSNAHGPNEFLHIPTAKKLTGCVAQLIHDWGLNQS
jgi:acetylornithine deacetylase/succinyl-diaminopimelate desuccinylase-like protein